MHKHTKLPRSSAQIAGQKQAGRAAQAANSPYVQRRDGAGFDWVLRGMLKQVAIRVVTFDAAGLFPVQSMLGVAGDLSFLPAVCCQWSHNQDADVQGRDTQPIHRCGSFTYRTSAASAASQLSPAFLAKTTMEFTLSTMS